MPTLKLLRTRLKLLLIELKIKQKDCIFVIDTGAEHSLVSPEFFKLLNLSDSFCRIVLDKEINGVSGASTTKMYPNLKINILGKTITNIHVHDSFGPFFEILHQNIDGILGEDLLSQFNIVEINYVKGTIKFT